MTEQKFELKAELDPTLATPQRLRKYGNVKMPAVPLPYSVSTCLVADDAAVPVWIHKQEGRTFLIAEISIDLTPSVGEKQKRERGLIEKKEGKNV